MTELLISGKSIPVDGEGFLLDATDWSRDVAQHLASASGIQLTDRHWQVLELCRKDFETTGQSPGIRRITKMGAVTTKEMYSLFPGGPGKLSAKLAGLKKPTGCV